PEGLVGVVAGAHRVDVVAAGGLDGAVHILGADGAAGGGVPLMAVDAVEDDPLPVQLHHALPQPKAAEAGLVGDGLLEGPGGVPQGQGDGVEGGVLVVPFADAGQPDRLAIDISAAVLPQGHGGIPEDGAAGGGHGAAEGAALQAGPVRGAQAQAGGQDAGGVVRLQTGPEPQVLDVQGGLGVQVHRAEDAEEAEKVLVLQ